MCLVNHCLGRKRDIAGLSWVRGVGGWRDSVRREDIHAYRVCCKNNLFAERWSGEIERVETREPGRGRIVRSAKVSGTVAKA